MGAWILLVLKGFRHSSNIMHTVCTIFEESLCQLTVIFFSPKGVEMPNVSVCYMLNTSEKEVLTQGPGS